MRVLSFNNLFFLNKNRLSTNYIQSIMLDWIEIGVKGSQVSLDRESIRIAAT